MLLHNVALLPVDAAAVDFEDNTMTLSCQYKYVHQKLVILHCYHNF